MKLEQRTVADDRDQQLPNQDVLDATNATDAAAGQDLRQGGRDDHLGTLHFDIRLVHFSARGGSGSGVGLALCMHFLSGFYQSSKLLGTL
jgi:hypothetical protein